MVAIQLLNKSLELALWSFFWRSFFQLLLLLFSAFMKVLAKQISDSMIKAWPVTDWAFSQKISYWWALFCTVAPWWPWNAVKPQWWACATGSSSRCRSSALYCHCLWAGARRKTPRFHRFLRRNYDRYGYPFAKTYQEGMGWCHLLSDEAPWNGSFLLAPLLGRSQARKPESLCNTSSRFQKILIPRKFPSHRFLLLDKREGVDTRQI